LPFFFGVFSFLFCLFLSLAGSAGTPLAGLTERFERFCETGDECSHMWPSRWIGDSAPCFGLFALFAVLHFKPIVHRAASGLYPHRLS